MKVYYAHPMAAYGTRREQEELEIIRRKAPGAEIVNPAQYSGDPSKTHERMEFYHGLVDECDVVVYSDIGGEFVSAGVGEEVDYALEKGKPVYKIDRKTRRLVRVYGKAKHLSRTGTRLLYRTMKWSGLRGEDLHKIVQMKIAEFGGRLSEEDALLMVAADLGVNTLKEAPKQIKAEKPSYRDAETLRRLYWEERLSTTKIGKLLGVDPKTVRNWMGKHGIECRTISEAKEIYTKIPFSGNPIEKEYMLGLYDTDICICRERKGGNIMRCSTTTTDPAMIELVKKVWGKYGHFHKIPTFNPDTNQYEFNVRSNVDGKSFDFSEERPKEVPKGYLFWPFLAYYAVGEGSWGIYELNGYIGMRFRLENTDCELLKQINDRLEEYGFHPKFRLVDSAGEGRRTKDYYGVFLERKDEVVALAEKLLPYVQHREKIEKMRLILEIKDKMYWVEVKDKVVALREKINREVEECVKEVEEEYRRRHDGKDWFEVHNLPKPENK